MFEAPHAAGRCYGATKRLITQLAPHAAAAAGAAARDVLREVPWRNNTEILRGYRFALVMCVAT
eukprot:COSAG05_NODE_534_length_8874_cov_19.159544_5_plen_64_part_00